LAFDDNYQIGSGFVSAILLVLLLVPSAANIWSIAPNVLVTTLSSPFQRAVNIGVTVYAWCFDWGLVGLLVWTLFITFLCTILVSGNPLMARPFERLRDRFRPVSTVISRTTLTAAFVVAWLSPFSLLWSVLPEGAEQSVVFFVEAILIITVPMLIISYFLPFMAVHKGLSETRERLLFIKKCELEEIKKFRKSEQARYLRIERHLILDYKDAQNNPVWLFDVRQSLQLFGSVFLPLITFWLSIQLRLLLT
jgi:hypothetical protein